MAGSQAVVSAPESLPTRPAATPRTQPGRSRRRSIAPYLFLLPWLVGFVGLTLGPLVSSLYLSATDFDLLSRPHWVGLANFVTMFTSDPRYIHSLIVTSIYVVLTVPLKLALALIVAMVLQRVTRSTGLYRSLFYLPSLLGGSVAVSVMWQRLFSGDGLVNNFLRLIGWHNPPAWVNEPSTALYTLVVLALWEFGAPMIIFLAALQQIPPVLYEAALVDGASARQRLVRITLPMITPVILFNLVMQVIGSYKSFTPAYVVSRGTGGPLDSTLMYGLYLYQQGFTSFKMGYASAMAWVLIAILAILTAVLFGTSRLWVHYDD